VFFYCALALQDSLQLTLAYQAIPLAHSPTGGRLYRRNDNPHDHSSTNSRYPQIPRCPLRQGPIDTRHGDQSRLRLPPTRSRPDARGALPSTNCLRSGVLAALRQPLRQQADTAGGGWLVHEQWSSSRRGSRRRAAAPSCTRTITIEQRNSVRSRSSTAWVTSLQTLIRSVGR
jgi:hypothetical protein